MKTPFNIPQLSAQSVVPLAQGAECGRTSCSFRAVLFRAAVALALVLPLSIHAGQRELKGKSSEKVDAVLVLDTSGSMLVTDPLRLRDKGATLFTQFLKTDDRLAIVQFAESASVVRGLTPYQKENETQIAEQIGKLSSDGTYTNIAAGIKLAKTMLEESPREDAEHIIVLLSDGKMEPDPATGTPSNLTSELMNGILPELKAKGIKVYTVAFSEHADKELLASIALATEGVNWFTENADKLHQSYADLFLAVKKPQMVPLTGKGFHVDDNIQEATFYVSRNGAEELQIVSPDGKTVSLANRPPEIKWFKSDKFDVVTIENPTPGDWQISGLTPEEGFATILTNLKLATIWPATGTAQTPILLEARLYEGDKPVALPEVSGVTKYGYQIIPTDLVSAPITKGNLNDDGKEGDKIAGDGIFSVEIEIEDAGEYKLRVVAQSPTFNRTQQMPFRLKPPLITLSVVSREVDEHAAQAGSGDAAAGHSHGSGHGGGHGGDESEHAADAAPAADDSHHEEKTSEHDATAEDGAGHEKEKHEQGTEPPTEEENPAEGKNLADYVVIELSEEASQLKDIEIKCIAIGADRKRYKLPMVRVDEGKGNIRYELPVAALPREGVYSLQATLSGVGKNRKSVKAVSKTVNYKMVNRAGEEDVVKLVPDEKPKPPEPFPWIGLLVLAVGTSLSSAGSVFVVKRAKGGKAIQVPDFTLPDRITAEIDDLKKRIEIVEVDLAAPLFTDPNFKIAEAIGAPTLESGEAPADTGDAATEDSAEEGAEEAPPPQEAGQ